MIYLINTKTKEHIDAVALGDAEYERLAGSSGWIFQMADTDGWIEWQGGECPLPDGHLCDVRHRDGDEGYRKEAGRPGRNIGRGPATAELWSHDGVGGDIIAYRPGLNASADPKTPAWDGEGLPPVGCECEVNGTPLHDGQDGWKRCEIIAHTDFGHGPIAVARVCDDTQCAWGTAGSFRPIRSEEDRAKEAIAGEVLSAVDNGLGSCFKDVQIAAVIYAAIRDGKVPGVKLDAEDGEN